ncbi:hypothetical protein M406DRAFT_66868 [Cryphonectria parasitica EP155]|uniref:Uncharacterized protein n=1 Tax=Cryphonectria parasitica (strain ATCC 38755 / EP155) TaxID=660469 RepID=A0A9P4YBS4_CRYP1|nr:uncharacterized protein M406DRAFT_66868 [Cryphonectria parasitica EP155]KAF3770461.1 hypothetical protein M406DRAFT_66868 [Cryphonectria parasitica EP155]
MAYDDHHYSDSPQVVPDTGQRLQVVTDPNQFPEPVYASQPFPRYDKAPPAVASRPTPLPAKKRICRLAPRTFYIVLGVSLAMIIGAAVGGGVGAALTSQKSNESSTGDSSSSSASSSSFSSPPTKTSTKPVSVTTTDVVGPTSTLYRDCPSSNNTLYSVTFGSEEYVFRKFCNTNLLGNADDMVNKPVTDLNACIDLCAEYNNMNATEIAQGGEVCNAVCWYNNFDADYPGQCFGFTSQNSSISGFQYQTTGNNNNNNNEGDLATLSFV